ncbi:D-glycero-D-manno-heptose 1,7-bisphosphate phosphatase [Bacillus sp. JCM 19047]|nr:D-glycero-D-manno-heptose 1,7-bisphosphate phosphatase [Bacillus sp. JCM 19047]
MLGQEKNETEEDMNQAVFLDRDGVINEVKTNRVTFVNKPTDFYLLDGVGEAIRSFNQSGFAVFVVTNQGGVGLGYMTEKTLRTIHEKMVKLLAQHGATVNDIAYCIHRPNEGCHCRKPGPLMIKQLSDMYGVDPTTSIMVGDREPDIKAGKKAGCKTVLVGSRTNANYGADAVFKTLADAVPWILKEKSL